LEENGPCKSKLEVQVATMKKKKQNGDAQARMMKENDENANKLQQ
jgi:hypothetical protein